MGSAKMTRRESRGLCETLRLERGGETLLRQCEIAWLGEKWLVPSRACCLRPFSAWRNWKIILPALLHTFCPSDIGGSVTLLTALGSSAASQMLLQGLNCNPTAHFQLGSGGSNSPSKLPAVLLVIIHARVSSILVELGRSSTPLEASCQIELSSIVKHLD